MRAFLAIPVLAPALDAFGALRARVVGSVAGVRWAPPASPHLTLHFFGSITVSDSQRVICALGDVLREQQRMTLRLQGLGSFPSAAAPRVLWWGVDGDRTALMACVRACRATLRSGGFAVDERRYRAHCTLGRPRQPWPAEAREAWQRFVLEDPRSPDFTADRAILYASVTGPDGVIHVPAEVMAFGDAPAQH